jgi:S1-C subfamily serine protease
MASRSKFIKISGAAVILALLVMGAYGGRGVLASQATATATATVGGTTMATETAAATGTETATGTAAATGTMTATGTATATGTETSIPPTTSSGGGAAATSTATRRAAATTAATMLFPLCTNTSTMQAPAGGASETEEATEAATGATGTAEATPRPGFIGIVVEQVDNCGARITVVDPNSPASRAGLRVGDIIVAIHGMQIDGIERLEDELYDHHGGDRITLTVQRGNREQTINVTLGNGKAL